MNVAMQPTTTARLSHDNPASTPPAALITARPPYATQTLRPASIQAIHPATESPSATAMAVPRASLVAGPGLAKETAMNVLIAALQRWWDNRQAKRRATGNQQVRR